MTRSTAVKEHDNQTDSKCDETQGNTNCIDESMDGMKIGPECFNLSSMMKEEALKMMENV